jgi:uncharacterized protein YgiM (DUF1202 family)
MKRLCLWIVALGAASAACAATMRVQVQSGQVRSAPSYLGGVVATVSYGQAVEVVAEQGAWQQVRTPDGKTGWMHASALTAKKVSMQAGGAAQSGASGDEMALAGKGFNKDVEAQFKAGHADVDFTWVDRMATMKAGAADVERFVAAGGLAQPGGAK